MENELRKAIDLRKNGDNQRPIDQLKQLAQLYLEHAEIQYQCAWNHDVIALEKEAIPFYEKAIQLKGLTRIDLQGAYLGLGSTYRTIGAYEESEALLLLAITEFPENKVYSVFLAMTYYNLGKHFKAMEGLLTIISQTINGPNLQEYQTAIAFYTDKLDHVW
ncbi:tetratricopeptide repeat protein [Carnobacterium gallinarum]|uniref:tetratricopeptide repeat protein n=1 Tax=Carnobacterium gallinarum TaxID=2749 RepID=UPI0005590E1C|nr:tetratricopeptide repeat protein [Carnobacterium gallinarum]